MSNTHNNITVTTIQPLSFNQYHEVEGDINKFMEHELVFIKQLDILQFPYRQSQQLIDQGLELLYQEHLSVLLQQWDSCHSADNKNKNIKVEYDKYHSPTTLGEWCQIVQSLYKLISKIEESMNKALSEYADVFNYQGQDYQQVLINLKAQGAPGYSANDYTPQQEAELKKHYELNNVVGSDAGVNISIRLAKLGEKQEVFLGNVGKNLLWLKKLWQPSNSLSMRLCAGPVLAQTQGIVRGLVYMRYKELQVAKLKIQQGGDGNNLINTPVVQDRKQYWFDMNYVFKIIKLIEQESIIYYLLKNVIWCEYSCDIIYPPFQGSIYGKYQQLGSGQSLKQYAWERNPLLSQEFEDNAEYFSSYHLELANVCYNKHTEIVEWLLFANIAHNPGNQQWLMWREQVRKFVELMGDNYTLTQIKDIINYLYYINYPSNCDLNREEQNKLQNIITQVQHSDFLSNIELLKKYGNQLISNNVIEAYLEDLSKNLVQLRAKLLAAPYQYGEKGGRVHIGEGQRSSWYYD